MASRSQQTDRKRKAKKKPNKGNMKKNHNRFMANIELINRLEGECREAQS